MRRRAGCAQRWTPWAGILSTYACHVRFCDRESRCWFVATLGSRHLRQIKILVSPLPVLLSPRASHSRPRVSRAIMVAPAVVVTARMPFVAVSRPRMDASRARARRSNSGRIPRAGALRSRRRARASVPSAAAGDATSGGKTDGAGVAVVGIGTRGGVVVDRLLAQGVLPAPSSGPSTPTPSPSSPRARPTAGASPRATSTPLETPARRTPSPPRAASSPAASPASPPP